MSGIDKFDERFDVARVDKYGRTTWSPEINAQFAQLRAHITRLEAENKVLRDEIDDARTILANKRNELIIPPDVCSGCLGLGSHVQSGMACPHCGGTGSV
jgi:hypothetical protein